jgi:hypothetical protein
MTSPTPTLDIAQMMLQEDDPRHRATLVLMSNFVSSLKDLQKNVEASTELFKQQSHSVELSIKAMQIQLDENLEVFNKAKGAGWITSKLVPFLLALLTVGFGFLNTSLTDLKVAVASENIVHADLRAKITAVENKAELGDMALNGRVDRLTDLYKGFQGLKNKP